LRETSAVFSRLSYYHEKFDVEGAPNFSIPSRTFELLTEDGVLLSGTQLGDVDAQDVPSWVCVHGLLAHHRAPGLREFAQSLSRYGPVFALDLRGHGLSSGECTLGNREAIDVDTVAAHVRRLSNRPVILVGFSMGAAASVRAAALYGDVDAVVSISGPARWHGSRRWAAQVTRSIWKTPGGTTLLRHLTGVRIHPGWLESESPSEVVVKIAPTPVLVVHGTKDQFFPPEEAQLLFENAHDPKELWMVDGGGHAEGFFMEPAKPVVEERVDAFVDELTNRVLSLMRRDDPWPV
jgi:pimeloyl-ACP methyl ester carboxylesterase